MKNTSTKIILGIVAILVALQLFSPDRTTPTVDSSKDFIATQNPPSKLATIIESACYDCHSYQTEYPWYSNVEPLSWWIQYHVDHGREELNFSTWTDYTADRADHKLEEAIEYVENKEMPLPSYTWLHPEADLSDQQREELADWFSELRSQLSE